MTSTIFAKLKIFESIQLIFDHTKLKIFQNMKNNNPGVLVGGLSRGPQQETTPTTMIGAKMVIKGDVSGEENLWIEGKFEGTVNLPSGEVTVGKAGQVSADITAKVLMVDGRVEGEIRGTEKVVISKTGHIEGNISSSRVILEDGAKLKGSIDMDPTDVEKVTAAGRSPVKTKSAEEPNDQAKEIS